MNDPTTQNIHDVVNMLERTYQSMKDYPRWEEDEDEVKESASKAKKQYQHRSHSRPENRMFLYMRHMTSFRKNMRYRRMTSLSFMLFSTLLRKHFFGIADAADYSKMAV